MRHKLTQRAENDLQDIYRYTVDNFGRRQAEKYLKELDAVFELLAAFPNAGRIYAARTHQFVHGKQIILYRMAGDDLVIGRIFHGAQRRD